MICGLSRRRRLLGRGRARPPRHRRPAHLHLRRQRPAAQGRSRARRRGLPRPLRHRPRASSTPRERFLERACRRQRPRAEAQDHRPRFHRGLRGRGARHRRASSSSPRARSIPTSSSRSRFNGPSRHHQEPPQRRRPARAHEAQAGRAAARALQGRGPRARRASSACPTTSSGASRSPARAWPSACSARSPRSALDILRDADAIVVEEIKAAGLYDKIWQAFAVLLPVQDRRRHGRRAHLRERRRHPRRRQRRRHDRRLGARCPYDLLAHDLEPHHQRSARRQPRRLRHLLQAARRRSSGSDRPPPGCCGGCGNDDYTFTRALLSVAYAGAGTRSCRRAVRRSACRRRSRTRNGMSLRWRSRLSSTKPLSQPQHAAITTPS